MGGNDMDAVRQHAPSGIKREIHKLRKTGEAND
jgi:hypothetical protein